MTKIVYLDNAASTRVAPEVVRMMRAFLDEHYGNPSSIHQMGEAARDAVEKAREMIARTIHAQAHEIVFTSGGTESNNLALKGAAYALKVKKEVATTTVEHHSVLSVCGVLQQQGFKVKTVPVDCEGFVDLNILERALTKKTAVVSVIHGNNEIGTVNDITCIGELCTGKNVLFHSDACQSFLKENINVKKMSVDLLTLNAHKIHGPKGIGALYVREGVRIEPQMFGGQQEHRIRAGTENVAGIVGFGEAVRLWDMDDCVQIGKLRDRLFAGLLLVDDSQANGSRQRRLCNNVHVSFLGVEGEAVVRSLDQQGIMASTGSACTSHQIESSHVLRAIGLSEVWARGSVRLSLSRYTNQNEIKETIGVVENVVDSLRKLS